jgi:hypothetical protein
MKYVFAVFPVPRSVSFVAGSSRFIGSVARRIAARVRFPGDRYKECCVNIRSVCSSAAAALGIGWSAWSSSALAGTVFVHAAYVPAAAVCPPPRPVYAPSPAYVVQASVMSAATVATPVKSLPYAAVPIPVPCGVVAPAAVPARNIVYAQPVRAVPAVTVSAIATPR